jgi:hypothetical protein
MERGRDGMTIAMRARVCGALAVVLDAGPAAWGQNSYCVRWDVGPKR